MKMWRWFEIKVKVCILFQLVVENQDSRLKTGGLNWLDKWTIWYISWYNMMMKANELLTRIWERYVCVCMCFWLALEWCLSSQLFYIFHGILLKLERFEWYNKQYIYVKNSLKINKNSPKINAILLWQK